VIGYNVTNAAKGTILKKITI